jgi:hypothetical protein
VIQAIGRALRLHPDKTLATIYVPYTSENDLERIQSFLAHLSTYDERIKASMDSKSIGGYIRLERMEESKEEIEYEKSEKTLCGHRYNLVADSMGKSDQYENIWNSNLEKCKTYINTYKKLPENKLLFDWLKRQRTNYKCYYFIMKRPSIRLKWEEFINEYREYFLEQLDIHIIKWKKKRDSIEKNYLQKGLRPSVGSKVSRLERSDAKWIGHQKTNYTYNNKLMKYETVKKMWEALVKKYEVLINIKDTSFSVEEKLKMLDDYITQHNKLPVYEVELDNGFKIGSFMRCIFNGNNRELAKPYIDKNPLLKKGYTKVNERNRDKVKFTPLEKKTILLDYIETNDKIPLATYETENGVKLGLFWTSIKSGNQNVNIEIRKELLKNKKLKEDYDKVQVRIIHKKSTPEEKTQAIKAFCIRTKRRPVRGEKEDGIDVGQFWKDIKSGKYKDNYDKELYNIECLKKN